MMRYRVCYRNQKTGEVARFAPMARDDALEVARQLVCDGEWGVQIEDQSGQSYPLPLVADK